MDDPNLSSLLPPDKWREVIDAAEAELAAGGETVPAETVIAELREANRRMMIRLGREEPDAA